MKPGDSETTGSDGTRYQELFERVPIGLYRTTPDGAILDVNPALIRMLGYADRASFLEHAAESVYVRNEDRNRFLAELEANGTIAGFDAEWLRTDGSVIWVEENAHAVRDAHGRILHYEGSAEDITARRTAEARLAEERAHFEQLFAASPEAVVLCANDATVLRVNEEFTRLFGYSEDEAIGHNVDELVAEGLNGLHEHACDVTGSIAGGETTHVETKRRRKDGAIIDVSILGRSIVVDGEQVALYAIYRDIGERVAMERKLAEERARFEQLFAASPEAVVLCANDATVLRVNEEFTQLFGYKEDEAVGRNIDELVAEGLNGLHEHACDVTDSIAGGETTHVETKRRRKDGAIIDVSILGRSIVVDGKQIALYAIYRDIGERVAMERKLAEERAHFEQLFAASPEAIVLCANDGSIVRLNEEFTRLFGYTAEDAIGRNVDELVAPTSNGLHDEAKGITAGIAEGRSSFVETRRRTKDGRLIDVSILGKPILIDGDQIAVYGIYRDISARVEAEATLAATRQKVERLHDAAVALGEAETEDEVYRATVDAAERVLGFSHGVLQILDDGVPVCRAASSRVKVESPPEFAADAAAVVARSLDAGEPILVDDPAPETLPNGLPATSRSLICAPIGEVGVFQAASPEPGAFSAEDGRLLSILLSHTAVAVSRLQLQGELIVQARHDALTGVFNRHYFNELISQEVLRSSRYDHPIGLVMTDVDRFKEINDRYGHQVGDVVLQEIASVLRETVRSTDMIVRYGGDEFLVVLTETGENSEEVADRIQHAVHDNEKLRQISGFRVTVSVGSIFWHPRADFPIEEALARADARMYEDKRRR